MLHKISCVNPWYNKICQKNKRVDGRCGEKYNNISKGDKIEFSCKSKSCICLVTRVTHYPSFEQMLITEGLENVLPGIKTIEQGIKIYRAFYSETFEKEWGALAIAIEEDKEEDNDMDLKE